MRDRRMMSMIVTAVAVTLAMPATGSADPGDLVESFGADGRVVADFGDSTVSDVVVQPDGRIVVLFDEVREEQSHAVLRRFRPGGALDPSFGAGAGEVDLGARTLGAALALDGSRLVVIVDATDPFTLTNHVDVWRLRAGGSPDPTFSDDGRADFEGAADTTYFARDVAVDSRRRVVVLAQASPGTVHLVQRLTTVGAPDTGFGVDGSFDLSLIGDNDSPRRLAIGARDQIAVVSRVTTSTDPTTSTSGFGGSITLLTAAGRPDTRFGGDGQVEIVRRPGFRFDATDVAIGDDRSVLVVGTDTLSNSDVGRVTVVRFTRRGGLDDSFSGDGQASFRIERRDTEVRDLAVRSDGSMLVLADADGGRIALAAVRANGRLDRSFAGDGQRLVRFPGAASSSAEAMTLTPSGRRLLVAGSVTLAGQRFGMAAISLV